ncbi:MAG: type IX secretion system membrane protein PorP/SprF, partial [Bacteroidota bacterium]|nr:type IX secretion system membrane protein PorP/SprF [Bacteroidota bacterium]
MKKYFFYIVFLFGYCISFAQQVPQYSNFLNNYFALNPALAGSNQCLNVKIGYRNQWVGFSGAPKTTFASFSSELKHKKIQTLRSKHGIGGYVES